MTAESLTVHKKERLRGFRRSLKILGRMRRKEAGNSANTSSSPSQTELYEQDYPKSGPRLIPPEMRRQLTALYQTNTLPKSEQSIIRDSARNPEILQEGEINSAGTVDVNATRWTSISKFHLPVETYSPGEKPKLPGNVVTRRLMNLRNGLERIGFGSALLLSGGIITAGILDRLPTGIRDSISLPKTITDGITNGVHYSLDMLGSGVKFVDTNIATLSNHAAAQNFDSHFTPVNHVVERTGLHLSEAAAIQWLDQASHTVGTLLADAGIHVWNGVEWLLSNANSPEVVVGAGIFGVLTIVGHEIYRRRRNSRRDFLNRIKEKKQIFKLQQTLDNARIKREERLGKYKDVGKLDQKIARLRLNLLNRQYKKGIIPEELYTKKGITTGKLAA